MSPVDESLGTQTPTQDHAQDYSKHRISWHPPDAYKVFPHLRELFEKACHRALKREGCDLAIIHQGNKKIKNSDGTKSFYMNVSAGKTSDPEKTRFMRLFDDGASQWYPPEGLPIKDKNTMMQAVSRKRRKNRGRSTGAQESPRDHSHAPYPEGFQAPGGE